MHFKVEYKLNWCVNLMTIMFNDIVNGVGAKECAHQYWGRVTGIDSGVVHIGGLKSLARIGDRVEIRGNVHSYAEIIAIKDDAVLAMPDASLSGMSPGDRAYLHPSKGLRPCNAWVGHVMNSEGEFMDGDETPQGEREMMLNPLGPSITGRRGLGKRLSTSLAPFDTFLPLCKGQRIGLFAGSGVGKSTLVGELAKGVEADIVIVALIGERSREVREFVEEILGPDGLSRSVVFASTCEEPAPSKRRCALMAITTAEYFRDQGLDVLVLFDSITRFADAHREIALTAGETPSLRAYPPSTFRAIASLAERTGPGGPGAGDVTAIFSVLVAGSDMDEPVADMVRGILDGHVVLDREIAERGRYPAINVRRSVSRSLPNAAAPTENKILGEARRLLSVYEDASAMIQTGLYAAGSDPAIDEAIKVWPRLDAFISAKTRSSDESYKLLTAALAPEAREAASGLGEN